MSDILYSVALLHSEVFDLSLDLLHERVRRRGEGPVIQDTVGLLPRVEHDTETVERGPDTRIQAVGRVPHRLGLPHRAQEDGLLHVVDDRAGTLRGRLL